MSRAKDGSQSTAVPVPSKARQSDLFREYCPTLLAFRATQRWAYPSGLTHTFIRVVLSPSNASHTQVGATWCRGRLACVVSILGYRVGQGQRRKAFKGCGAGQRRVR
jgi:hypothetical protein